MMNERQRNEGVTLGPGPYQEEFGSSSGGERHVEVIHGVHAHSLPLVGMTIRQARAELEDRMHIDPQAIAVVDGREVDENTELREGQVLNFVKRAGERGRQSPPARKAAKPGGFPSWLTSS